MAAEAGSTTFKVRCQQGVQAALAWLDRRAPLVSLFILVVLLSLRSERFLTPINLRSIGQQVAAPAMVALGETFVIISGGIDLSVGSVLALSGVIAGQCMVHRGWDPWLSCLLGIMTGALCGALTGLLIAKTRIPPFIMTLGMMGMARGATLILTQGVPVHGIPESVQVLGGNVPGWEVTPVWLLLGVAFFLHLLLSQTVFGRHTYAMGGSPQAARLSGVPLNRMLVLVYGLSGLCAGLAGIVLMARTVSAQPTAGEMYELDAIAAAVVGGASLMGGQGTIVGTLAGALTIAILRNGCNLLNISAYWQQVTIGALIPLAVLYDNWRRYRRGELT